MSKSTARRSRHKVSPEELPLTAPPSSNGLHHVPVVNSTPHQGTKSPIEPQGESAASFGAATPKPPIVTASSGLGRILHVNLNSPKSFGAIQPACHTETLPTALVQPTSSGTPRTAAAEAWIEQEEIDFTAVAEATEAEISRLHDLIEGQKAILTRAREKRDENIKKARGIIEASLNEKSAVDFVSKPSPACFICAIPPELLLPILSIVDMEWTPLRLVCKRWNSIILNNGHFWNDLVLTTRPDGVNPGVHGYDPWQPRQQLCRSLVAVENTLRRSKSAPLSITIDFVDFAGKLPDIDEFGETSFGAGSKTVERRRDAVKMVEKELPRIRSLSVFAIGGIESNKMKGSFKSERAVILEKLYIEARILRTLRFLDHPTDHLGHLTQMNGSGLVDLSIEGLFVDWEGLVTPLTLPKLRILRLGSKSLDALRKLRTPRLDSLAIHDLTSYVSHFGPVDVLSVTSLHLWHRLSILDMLEIPTITHIDLQSGKWTATMFKGAESRFPNLTSLVLCPHTSPGSISKGLEHLPHLADLCVDARHRKLEAVFWGDFTRTVEGRGRPKTPKVLPNLKRLHVRLHHERVSAIEKRATKAKVAREAAGCPLTVLIVEWEGGATSNIVGERRQKVNAAKFPRDSLSFPE